MATCYKHPDRETGVSCSNCGKFICTDCMTPTSVGMRCPECAGQKTVVRTAAALQHEPVVTFVMIGACILAFIAELATGSTFFGTGLAGQVAAKGALEAVPVAVDQQYWRLFTSAFLHDGIVHIGFNMYILYWVGRMIEPILGSLRFLALYLAGLFAGAFGALVINPNSATVGASGAIFGLLGAAFIMEHRRGVNPMHSGIGLTIVLNLALSFLIPNISIGGHIGGLVGGAIAGWLMDRIMTARHRSQLLSIAPAVVVGAVSVFGAILVAEGYANTAIL